MRKNIEQAIATLDYDEQSRMRRVITAFDNGKVFEVNFYSDGSGVEFTYYHPNADHGLPCTLTSSFRMEKAMIILAGHRVRSNEQSPICF